MGTRPTDERVPLFCDVGDVIVFRSYDLKPLTDDGREGMVRDEDVVAVDAGELIPANEWVRITPPSRVEAKGSIAIPRAYQRRENEGIVEAVGPGRLILSGKWFGQRRVWYHCIEVIGKRAHWTPNVEVLELGREKVDGLFIRAEDISFVTTRTSVAQVEPVLIDLSGNFPDNDDTSVARNPLPVLRSGNGCEASFPAELRTRSCPSFTNGGLVLEEDVYD
jgi:co-chaperonin GroES (HSP10)